LKKSVSFIVDGNPIPKQSFRARGNGYGYTDPRVKAWQKLVADVASIHMMGKDIMTGMVTIKFHFFLPDKRRKDWDNLSKCVSDALNGIVYKDDSQVTIAMIDKTYDKNKPGVYVLVVEND
jgi:Holliday junction resolvase RusA-like endonuclease